MNQYTGASAGLPLPGQAGGYGQQQPQHGQYGQQPPAQYGQPPQQQHGAAPGAAGSYYAGPGSTAPSAHSAYGGVSVLLLCPDLCPSTGGYRPKRTC